LATATCASDPVLRHAVRVLYPAEGGNLTTEDTENTEGENRERKNKEEGIQHSSVSSVVQKSFPRAVVMLYGNVPVRRGGMIDRCIEMLLETGCDSVQTIAPVGKMHPYWMFDLEGEGRIKKHVANDVFRRQDLPALYSPTGAVYAMRTEVLMAAEGSSDPHAFLGKDRRGLVVAAEDSVDLDTEKDLWVAEAMLRSNAETLQKLLRQPEMQNFPAWVVHTLSASPERLFARDGVSLRTTRFDASYLEFLQTQIKLEPRGPEWSAVLRRRHDGLAPFLDTDLMNLSIHAGENNFSLYTHPESLKVLFWETY